MRSTSLILEISLHRNGETTLELETDGKKNIVQETIGNDVVAETSKGLGTWLYDKKICLLITSYQSGRLLVIGATENGQVVLQQHQFDRAMGISIYPGGFVLGTLHQIWRFSKMNPVGKAAKLGQSILKPEACYYTGFVNCHDVAQTLSGEIIYASTLFNCVAKVTPNNNLTPIWVPPFITELVPEDRCHLNGLAVDGGKLRFVSMLGESNQNASWRNDRSKGSIFDLKSNRAIASNLWMPHSPRIYQSQLFALESGCGAFGLVDNGMISKILHLPGYPRGLDFCESVAAVGFSQPRHESIEGLPLQQRLEAAGIEPSCGVVFYDISAAKTVHSIQFSSGVKELYDVAFLHGTSNPILIHPSSNEIVKTYSIGIQSQKDVIVERAFSD
jgi:protein O-GlcNAc transferase